MNNRPVYEADFDRANERVFREYIRARGFDVIKLDARHYEIDFAIVKNGRIVRFAEFKRRAVNSWTYPNIILSLHKWHQLIKYSQHAPAALFVTFDDKTMFIKADDTPHPIKLAGRTDRGDRQDIEPCVHLPLANFSEWHIG